MTCSANADIAKLMLPNQNEEDIFSSQIYLLVSFKYPFSPTSFMRNDL